jgi:type II secretory pathway component GspD/PulD (secretin)
VSRTSLLVWLAFLVVLNFPCAGFAQEGDRKAPEPAPRFVPVYLYRASAATVAEKLTNRFGNDATIKFDQPNNIIFIRADANTTRRAKAMIEKLDDRSPSCMRIFYLQHASATDAVAILKVVLTLRELLDNEFSASVFAAERSNAVIISARQSQAEPLLAILRWLDTPR